MNGRKREMNLLIEFAKTWNVKFHPLHAAWAKRIPILKEKTFSQTDFRVEFNFEISHDD